MVRKSRKTQRRQRRRQQRGGGWGFTGPAFAPAGGMAPEMARALTDDCAVLDRPAPSVTPTGAWSQAGGACGSCAVMAPQVQQVGGMWPFDGLFGSNPEEPKEGEEEENPTTSSNIINTNPTNVSTGGVAIPVAQAGGRRRKSRRGRGRRQRGGGGGGGGYGFTLNNDLGKVYAATPVGPCPSGQRGGDAASVVSYPAGYGYGPSSAMEVGGGTAHFLAQIPYGKQCMGGGGRRRGRKSRRHGRKGHKGRKSRRNH